MPEVGGHGVLCTRSVKCGPSSYAFHNLVVKCSRFALLALGSDGVFDAMISD